MKNKFFIVSFFILLTSCDFILKETKSTPLENNIPEVGIAIEKDKNGCIEQAGYKWSIIKDDCIRVVDEGFRLNPIHDLTNLEASQSAYVLLNENMLNAEVFLQDIPKSIYFTRKSKDQDFIEKKYKLSVKSGYTLSVNDSVIYRAAETAIKPVLGTDLTDQ